MLTPQRAPLGLLLVLLGVLGTMVTGCTEERARDPRRDGGIPLTDGDVVRPDADNPTFRCTAGRNGCYGNVWYTCGDDGTSRLNETVCDSACDPELRCVVCRPGSRRCDGTTSMVCSPDGMTWSSGRDCSEWGSSCGGDGFCADACAEAERSKSNVGCEYWPVPLANTDGLQSNGFDFRVVVTNPNDTPANVRITRGGTEAWSGTVDARALRVISLPWIAGQSFAFPEGNWRSIVTPNGAYRLTSDKPVITSQFNPFEYASGSSYSYTNDGTLLYPTHVLTGDYVGVSYYPLSVTSGSEGFLGSLSSSTYPGYIALVGTAREPTRVQVMASGAVAADAAGRWPATRPGGSFTFMLAQGEVAHIAADIPPDCAAGRPGFDEQRECDIFGCSVFRTCREHEYDLTGTRIVADRPLATFGGHVCAYVPTNAEACDHLEVQVPPMQTWGNRFVSAPMGDGNMNTTNIVRVLPAFENTTVTVSPPQGGVSGRTLSPGEVLEFEATSPFEVTGSRPLMVAQYLRGQYASTPAAMRGDPAITLLVPEEQFRQDYTFALPTSYNSSTNGQNHLLIVRQPGTTLMLDGTPITATFTAVGDREVAVIVVPGGNHTITGTAPFGVTLYGLGSFSSYAMPAGLNMEAITILI